MIMLSCLFHLSRPKNIFQDLDEPEDRIEVSIALPGMLNK